MALAALFGCGKDRDFGMDAVGAGGSPGGAGGISEENLGGSGGSGKGTGGSDKGTGGSGGGTQDECKKPNDCPEPEEECLAAVCTEGSCDVEERAAGESCSAGVCSGAGSCGECVPGDGACTGRIPRLCSENGEWVEQTECALGSMCDAGRCRGLDVDWVVQANSSEWVETAGIGVDDDGRVYFAGTYANSLTIGSQTVSSSGSEPSYRDAFVARLSPEGQLALPLVTLVSSGYEYGHQLAVAPNGNHYFPLMAGGDFVGSAPVVGTKATDYALLAAFNPNGVLRSEVSFYVPDTAPAQSMVRNPVTVPTANGNRAYVLSEFRHHVRWRYPATPGYQEETPSGCHTLLAEVNAGVPTWSATYPWCSNTRKSMVRGQDGRLYVGADAGYNPAGTEPSTWGGVTFQSTDSSVIAKLDQTNGSILQIREISPANLQALVALPSGGIVAAFLTSSPLVIGDLELPASSGYLVRFDEDLNPTGHVALGSGSLTGFGYPSVWMAVNPAGEVFVAGGISSSFDFGAGLHEYQGTSPRGRLGDGFVAGYDSQLRLLFSETYGSGGNDRVEGIAADTEHLYVLLNFADTLDAQGTTLHPTGSGSAAVIKHKVH